MKIILDIPSEFCIDFINNNFEDCFQRLLYDTQDRIKNNNILLSGNYEIEI